MENDRINLRQSISRNINYTIVKLNFGEGDIFNREYIVHGKTTVKKELMKLLKNGNDERVPTITVEEKTEKRTMTIEKFIELSQIINEREEN